MTKEFLETKNIFDLIDIIQQRMAMFIPEKSIMSLINYLNGYETCLKLHGIIEEEVPNFTHFNRWLGIRFEHWNHLSNGWAYAIKVNIGDNEDPLSKFFSLIKEFRKLHPETINSINLNEKQKQTIKEIHVIKYDPEGLFFLRIYCNGKHMDDKELFRTLEEAQNWAEEKY